MTNRQMVYRFMELNYIVQREIMHDLGIVNEDEQHEDRVGVFFDRLKTNKDNMERLKLRLDPNHVVVQTRTHPCA